MKKIVFVFLAVILSSQLLGCQQTTNGTKLDGADKEAVLAFSEPKTDNLMAGLNANDYAMFSKDFDKEMLVAMGPDQFKALKRDRDAKLGQYVSRTVKEIYKRGDHFIVVYDAIFESNNAVTLQVVYQVAEPHAISGLWFDQ